MCLVGAGALSSVAATLAVIKDITRELGYRHRLTPLTPASTNMRRGRGAMSLYVVCIRAVQVVSGRFKIFDNTIYHPKTAPDNSGCGTQLFHETVDCRLHGLGVRSLTRDDTLDVLSREERFFASRVGDFCKGMQVGE